MNNTQDNRSQEEKNRQIVDKIASGKQASYTDEPLTPPRKIEAEQMRMKSQGTQEARQEEDKQVANLGGEILTPQKKMDRARVEASDREKRTSTL